MTQRSSGEEMGSIRWAFRCGTWTPTRAEWLLAARCIQQEEKDRIGKFVFAKDAKSAMAGRLLLRRFVCDSMRIPWSEITLERTPRGKPYLKVCEDSVRDWSFNISHQGDYAVLAADRGVQVGVDIMKTVRPGSSSVPEFFRIMTRQFTAHEWSSIQSAASEYQQLAAFYRHWALKESFIKAIGTGLGFNLQRVEFHLSPELLTPGRALRQTKMYLDEEPEENWIFEQGDNCSHTGGYKHVITFANGHMIKIWVGTESMLDPEHHVAVALGAAGDPPSLPWFPPPSAFTLLSFSELIASASPLTDEEPSYWENFKAKTEAPQRQSDAHRHA